MSDFDTESAVLGLIKYLDGYVDQPGVGGYPVETFVNDMLYGLGLAIDRGRMTEEFTGPSGFDRIKAHLSEYLEKGAHIGDWP